VEGLPLRSVIANFFLLRLLCGGEHLKKKKKAEEKPAPSWEKYLNVPEEEQRSTLYAKVKKLWSKTAKAIKKVKTNIT
jgi:hypothetical protein